MLKTVCSRMKYTLIFVFLFGQIHAQIVDRSVVNLDSFPASVQVKSVEMVAQVGFVDVDTTYRQTQSRYIEFDRSGKWIVRRSIFAEGDVASDSLFYDAKTRTQVHKSQNEYDPRSIITVFNEDGTVKSVSYKLLMREEVLDEYEYDKKKRLVRHKQTFAERLMVGTYEYNAAGLLVRQTISSRDVSDKKMTLDNEKLMSYNEQALCTLILENHYGTAGAIRVRDTLWNVYNKEKRLLRCIEHRQNGEAGSEREYEYDQYGRVITVKLTWWDMGDEEETMSIDRYEYDSQGYFRTHSTNGLHGTYEDTWKITYNEKGLPVHCVKQDPEGIYIYTWTYTYW